MFSLAADIVSIIERHSLAMAVDQIMPEVKIESIYVGIEMICHMQMYTKSKKETITFKKRFQPNAIKIQE